jgi:DNA-binding MarR family transcriptional regulator
MVDMDLEWPECRRSTQLDPATRSKYEQLPPSAKTVLEVLMEESELSNNQIVNRCPLPERTVRYAINKLEEGEFVESTHCLQDARIRLYSLDV